MSQASHKGFFDRLASAATRATGSSAGFGLAATVVVIWGALGPVFHYSETWQLVINTATTIVTFLMVFLIQHSQNKDSSAVHLKLNELIASRKGASNRLLSAEDLDERTLAQFKLFYSHLAQLAQDSLDVAETHSLEEATRVHEKKVEATQRVS